MPRPLPLRYLNWGLLVAFLLAIFFSFVPVQAQVTPVPEATIPADVAAEQVARDIVEFTEDTSIATVQVVNDFLERLVQRPQSEIARVILIIGGALLLVAGWRVYEYIILISGFLIGAAFGSALVPDNNTLLTVAGFLIGGIIGAAIASLLYYLAVALIGAYIGLAATIAIATYFDLTPVSSLVLLLGGIIGAIVLIALSLEFLIVISALVGAQMVSLGLNLGPEWVLILAVVGVIAQLLAVRAFGVDLRRRPQRGIFWRRATV